MKGFAPRSVATALSMVAALAVASCVDVAQDPPFSVSNPFTVAHFNSITLQVPFPSLTPCPTAVNPANGACPAGGTYDAIKNKVALPIYPICQSGQIPCWRPGVPTGCTTCDPPSGAALKGGLNTLDGFGNYSTLRTTFSGDINPATVSKQTAFMVNAATGRIADFRPSVATVDTLGLGLGLSDVTLTFEPDRPTSGNVTQSVRPLASKSTYIAVVTRGIADTNGRPIAQDRTFAFLASKLPLANDDGSPLLGSLLANAKPADLGCISGTEAQQQQCLNITRATLEASRKSYNQILTGVETATGGALKRENIAIAWPVKTQSVADALVGIRAQVLTQIPTVMLPPTSAQIPAELDGATLYAGAIPAAQVAVDKFKFGCTLTGMFLRPASANPPCAGDTFCVTPQGIPVVVPTYIPYVLATPKGVSPPYKTVIFGHGLGRWRYDMMAIANTLAGIGYATIAIDHITHGDRTNFTPGNENFNPANGGPSAGCLPRLPNSPEAGGKGNQCPAQAPADPTTGECAGGAPKIPSGAFAFSPTNLPFGSRDNIRQGTIDLMQLARTLAANSGTFDPTNIHYVGQSLGGIVGTIFTATEPLVKSAVLNVPGGGLTYVIRETPTAAICKPLFDGLSAAGICERADPTGAPCVCKDTASYRQFMTILQWVWDPADPINFAGHLIEKPLWCVAGGNVVPCSVAGSAGTPIEKKILIQKMEGDTVVPNATTHALRGAAGPRSCYREFTGGTHGFLLDPTDTNVTAGQSQVANFLLSGGATTNIQGGSADACPQ